MRKKIKTIREESRDIFFINESLRNIIYQSKINIKKERLRITLNLNFEKQCLKRSEKCFKKIHFNKTDILDNLNKRK
jgi:hypothetical protein